MISTTLKHKSIIHVISNNSNNSIILYRHQLDGIFFET